MSLKEKIPNLTYMNICRRFIDLQRAGEIKLFGEPTMLNYTDFDISVLNLFDCNISYYDVKSEPGRKFLREQGHVLALKINDGLIDIGWLDSPHAATLIKVKQARLKAAAPCKEREPND